MALRCGAGGELGDSWTTLYDDMIAEGTVVELLGRISSCRTSRGTLGRYVWVATARGDEEGTEGRCERGQPLNLEVEVTTSGPSGATSGV